MRRATMMYRVAVLLMCWLEMTWCQSGSVTSSDHLHDAAVLHTDASSVFVRPGYVVMAPGVVRAGTMYRVTFDVRHSGRQKRHTVDIRAALLRSGVQVAGDSATAQVGQMYTLMLQVPSNSMQGEYTLRVEGNHPGMLGGTLFANESRVTFSPKFLTILIETSRPVYNGGQTVGFRAVLLNHRLKPYDDSVDVFVLDPDGFVMRRWVARPTVNGVISLTFRLPALPKLGSWSVRVKVRGQTQDRSLLVEKYYVPRYEVDVSMPLYFLTTDEYISGEVEARFTETKKLARGTVTLQLEFRQREERRRNETFTLSDQSITTLMDGHYRFRFRMSSLLARVPRMDGADVRVTVAMRELYDGVNQTGYCVSRVLDARVRVQFVGRQPVVFKPGMPLSAVVFVSYTDGQPLTEEKLRSSSLRISGSGLVAATESWRLEVPRFEPLSHNLYQTDWSHDSMSSSPVNVSFHRLINEQMYEEYRSSGLYRFTIQTPTNPTRRATITAQYQDESGQTASASLLMVPQHSDSGQYLSVESSTSRALVGQYTVLHVRSNTAIDRFSYMVISKGLLLFAGEELIKNSAASSFLHTISVPVSSEMAPVFRVVVYHVTKRGNLLSDSVALPIDAISRNKVAVVANQYKDRLLNTVEVVCQAVPGAIFALSALRQEGHMLAAASRSSLSRESVQRALFDFDNSSRWVHTVFRRYRDGVRPDSVQYLTSANNAIDTRSTLDQAQLIVFTDSHVSRLVTTDRCNSSAGESACVSGGCFSARDRCDGRSSCADGTDELGCSSGDLPAPQEEEEDRLQFILNRKNRLRTLYNQRQGDWAWKDLYIGYKSSEEVILTVPHQDAIYYLNGFSVSQSEGFGIIEQAFIYNTTRPFHLRVECVTRCRRGEQVSLRAVLTNNANHELLCLLQLPASDKYRMVPVEGDGSVSRAVWRPDQLPTGTHQLLVPLRPYSSVQVDIPISVLVERGQINVTLTASSQLGLQTITKQILVEPEGVTIDRHTSLLLDLKDRAVDDKFLDLVLHRSPEMERQLERRFIYGSPRAHLTVSGDVVGPVFLAGTDTPVTTDLLLDRRMRSTDASVFAFGTSLWSLHYLRLTKQLQLSSVRPVFDQLNVEMAGILYRRRSDGAYSLWHNSPPSVWLTAWVVRVFDEARFQDWDQLLYVPSEMTAGSISWLLRHQNVETGAFGETAELADRPLDTKLHPVNDRRNISLTAQVLIALTQSMDTLEGQLRSRASDAKLSATRYLERELTSLTRAYDVAIVAHALILVNSGEAGAAFTALKTMKRYHDNMLYWSPEIIESNRMSEEVSQRDLIQPKDPQTFDSEAVETTAYALLVYLFRDAISGDQEKMVLWLNSMRTSDGGFGSTTASLMALRALTEYSYRARLREITDLRVGVKWSARARNERSIHLTNSSVARTRRVEIDDVWGHVQLRGRGSGQALAQLHVAYGVDTWSRLLRPSRPFFRLSINEQFLPFRNRSIGLVNVCLRWLYLEGAPNSGAAVLDVELPSGYVLFQPEADEIVSESRRVGGATLRHGIGSDNHYHERSAVWFFDSVPGDKDVCVNYTIRRWLAVSNMTQIRRALVYEQYQPEHFQMEMVNATTLYVLSVCEVCGSYQCPYCPHFSHTTTLLPPSILAIVVAAGFVAVLNVDSVD